MYIKEFDIVLDIKNSTEQEPFEVVQGDSQSNLLNISMTNGLEPYDLTGTTAEIVFYKSDSTTVQQTQKTGVVILNAPDGKIQCTLKTNTIACPGKVVAEVRVLSDEVLLTSARFEFYVRKSLINDKTIESTDEFPVLTQLMQDTSTLIDQVNQIEKQVPENVVSRIDAMESGKVDKTDIVQTDTISDASKVPSSVVTNKLSSQVTELNKNMLNGVNGFAILSAVTNLNDIDCNAIIHSTDASAITIERGYPVANIHCTVFSIILKDKSSGTRFGFQDVIYKGTTGSYRRYIYVDWGKWNKFTQATT